MNWYRIFKAVKDELNRLSRRVRRLEDSADKIGAGGTIIIEELDGTPSVVSVTTLILPNGTLTDNADGTVTYTPTVQSSGGCLHWPTNGVAEFHAYENMTLTIAYTNYNTGSVAWEINGSSASDPFVLTADDKLTGTLTGATSRATVALRRTA